MDFKKCDFCMKDFTLPSDISKGFMEMKYAQGSIDTFTLDMTNRLNRFVVTKKCFFTDIEKTVDICDNCLEKLFGDSKKR